jgi:hypothetical protein
MQIAYVAASVLAAATGLAHSILGERLVFRHLRRGTLVPSLGAPPLRERHVRILWATWHLATVFGLAFAGLLFQLALGGSLSLPLVVGAMVFAYLGGALLVLVGTQGRHPGWIALATVAALALGGSRLLS